MDKRIQAVIVGVLAGLGVILLGILKNMCLKHVGITLDLFQISYLPITGIITGWYYGRITAGEKSLFQQAVPPAISTFIVGLTGELIAKNLLMPASSSPVVAAAFLLVAVLSLMLKASIYGLFMGVAGYRLKDTKIATIKAGIFAMLVVFLLYIIIQLVYFMIIFPIWASDITHVLWRFLTDLAEVAIKIILLGIAFASLYKPFTELLKSRFFVNLHMYSFVLSVAGFSALLLAIFLLPYSSLIGLMAILVVAGLLAYLLINSKRVLKPRFANNSSFSYGAALVTIFTIPELANLLLQSSFGIGGLFTSYAITIVIPRALFIPTVFAFSYILLRGISTPKAVDKISYGLVGVRVSTEKKKQKPRKAKKSK